MHVLFQAVDWLKEWKSALTKREDVLSNTALRRRYGASEGVDSATRIEHIRGADFTKIPAGVKETDP